MKIIYSVEPGFVQSLKILESPWIWKQKFKGLESPWIFLTLVFVTFSAVLTVFFVTFYCFLKSSFQPIGPWISWYMALKVLEKALNFTLPDMYEPCWTRYVTHSLCSLVRYPGQHLKKLSIYLLLVQNPSKLGYRDCRIVS